MHWLLLRSVLQTKLSFSIFYQVCASGMVCGRVCGMCKILYHTTNSIYVPSHLMPYALVMFSCFGLRVVKPVLELFVTYENCVVILIFSTVGCWFLVCFVTLHLLWC